MNNNRWLNLTLKLWPDVRDYNQPNQMRAEMAIIALTLTVPLALISFAWLSAVTDWALLAEHIPAFVILTGTLLILNHTGFSIQFDLGENNDVSITGSLTKMVSWGAILVLGPSILWAYGVVILITAVLIARRQVLYNENPLWPSLALLLQEWGVNILTPLMATAVYQALGGVYPLAELDPTTWPELAASLIVLIFLPSILFLPTVYEISRLSGEEKQWINVFRLSSGNFLLGLLSDPFSILLALSFSLGGLVWFLFFIVGIILVNWLLHLLSRANTQQQRHYRELAILEEFSEMMLKSAPDASELPVILTDHLPKLFTRDRIQIRLFEQPGEMNWPFSQLSYPPNHPNANEEDWDKLQQAAEKELLIRNVVMPEEKGVFGDAVMVKIMAPPDDEDPELTNKCLGGIYLIRHKFEGKTADSISTLQGLAAQIGAALFRAQAHKEFLQNHKMVQELEFAGHIQASFLPKQLPQVEGWDITATIVPARQTSGDFYDFVDLGDGRIGLIVADVSDKGTGAALYMALTRTLIRTYATHYPDAPELALKAANNRIFADTESEQFVTVFYGVLDTENGRLTYANAGHNPAFVVGSQKMELSQTGIPLGMYEEVSWRQDSVQLALGDTLAAYTDGVPEAENEDKVEFGEDRLWQILQSGNGRTASETATAVLSAIDAFVGDVPQFDDITLMVVSRHA